jgi:hypothetical protein
MESAKRAGISSRDISFNADGSCNVASKRAQNAYSKHRGLRNLDAGYSDWAGDGRAGDYDW